MEKKTTVYVKLDTGKEVRVEMTHVTEAVPGPNEVNRERELSVREMAHVSNRLKSGDYSLHSHL